MFFNKKSKQKFEIIKIYKIVSLNEAKLFNIKECINLVDLFFQKKTNSKPNSFDLNFGAKDWNSYSVFNKEINKFKSIDIVSIVGINKENNSFFSITNSLLNTEKSNEIDYIEIILALNVNFLSPISNIKNFIEKIHNGFEIDYGYSIYLDDSYDFLTERKKKKSFFGLTQVSSITKEDISWYEKIPDVKNGYLKNIYLYNFLNKNQIESLKISKCIKANVGEVIKINDDLFLWSLKENELS